MSASGMSTDETVRVGMCHMTHDAFDDKDLFFRQSLKYADDLVKVYEDEKKRREVLEEANRKLLAEIAARRQAEYELRMAHEELERRVFERTKELSLFNEKLKVEIAQRIQAEARMRSSLREKETLLSEIHHRVKNNLQIVSSLLSLQSDHVSDPNIVHALKDSQGRIRSMALIHDQLYRSTDLSQIDYAQYLESLALAVMKSHSAEPDLIRIEIRADHVFLPVDQALPCSLVINELMSNALKHAFAENASGTIQIDFQKRDSGDFSFSVSDNGKGLPGDFDVRQTTSLGLQLVVNLVESQLRGSLHVTSTDGTAFHVQFPARERA